MPRRLVKGDQAAIAIDADKLERLDGRDIVGVGQGGAHGHRSVEAAVIVDRLVGRAGVVRVARRREIGGHIPDQGGGRPAFFEGGQRR